MMMGTICVYNYTCVCLNESICMKLGLFYFENTSFMIMMHISCNERQ